MIVPDEIEEYAAAHTTPPLELLQELAAETRATLRAPQMLTGTIEGRFLELLVHGLGAKRVLDEADESAETRTLRELNDRLASDERVVAVQLSVRDGITLVRRR